MDALTHPSPAAVLPTTDPTRAMPRRSVPPGATDAPRPEAVKAAAASAQTEGGSRTLLWTGIGAAILLLMAGGIHKAVHVVPEAVPSARPPHAATPQPRATRPARPPSSARPLTSARPLPSAGPSSSSSSSTPAASDSVAPPEPSAAPHDPVSSSPPDTIGARVVRLLLGQSPRALLPLLVPTGLAVLVDVVLRGRTLAGYALQGKAIYASSILIGAAIWMLPLWCSARLLHARSERADRASRVLAIAGIVVLFVAFVFPVATLGYGGQALYHRVFHSYMGRDTLRLGVALRGTVADWFVAWGTRSLLGGVLGLGAAVTAGFFVVVRKGAPAIRGRVPVVLAVTFPVALGCLWFDQLDSRFLQAATPDTCFVHGVVHALRVRLAGQGWIRKGSLSAHAVSPSPAHAVATARLVTRTERPRHPHRERPRRRHLLRPAARLRRTVPRRRAAGSRAARAPHGADPQHLQRVPRAHDRPRAQRRLRLGPRGAGRVGAGEGGGLPHGLRERAEPEVRGLRDLRRARGDRHAPHGDRARRHGAGADWRAGRAGDRGDARLRPRERERREPGPVLRHPAPVQQPRPLPHRPRPPAFPPQLRGGARRRRGFDNRYRNSVRLQERMVAGFLRQVRDLPGWNDTAVVFLSDHGEQFREHGGLYHNHSLYDEELRVPGWIAAGANVLSPDERVALATYAGQRTYAQDVHATLVDLIGLYEARASLPRSKLTGGRSLLRPRRQEPEPSALLATSTAVWEPDDARYGVMRGTRVLVASAQRSWVCFDLTRDPEEHEPLPAKACGGLLDTAKAAFSGVDVPP